MVRVLPWPSAMLGSNSESPAIALLPMNVRRFRLMVFSSMDGLVQAGDRWRAAHEASAGSGKKFLRLLVACRKRNRAAAREIAAAREVDRTWNFAAQRLGIRAVDATPRWICDQMRGKQRLRIGVQRTAENLLTRAEFHDLTEVHDGDAMAHVLHGV